MVTKINGTLGIDQVKDGTVETADLAFNPFGFKNRIINGAMEIAQRGTSATVSNNVNENYSTLDRFSLAFGNNAKGQAIFSQVDVNDPIGFSKALRLEVTQVNTPQEANEVIYLSHVVEGLNLADTTSGSGNEKEFTFSFKARTNVTGTYCVVFRSRDIAGTSSSYTVPFTVNGSGVWETVSITLPESNIRKQRTDNNQAFQIFLTFAISPASSQISTVNEQWQDGLFLSTAGINNLFSTIGNFIEITGVQLEEGTEATPFERRPYGLELNLCQRYFERIDALTSSTEFAVGQAVAATTSRITVPYKVQKRSTPSFSTSGFATFSLTNSGGTFIASTGIGAFDISGTNVAVISVNVSSGLAAGNATRLAANTTPCFLAFDSEL